MKRVVQVQHPRAPGCCARELEGCVYSVGTRVGEKDGVQPGWHALDQLLREQACQKRTIHLHQTGTVKSNHFLDHLL